jgi:hypothetical protein
MQRRKFITGAGLSLLGLSSLSDYSFSSPKKRSQVIKTRVLVVGGGPAGIGAAIAASKAGAETLLIEDTGYFGGIASLGLGMCMNQMRPNSEPRGFIHELLLEKLQNYGDQAVRLSTHQFFVNVDYLKVAIMDALDVAGCKYLVHLKAVDAIRKGSKVTGVTVSSKSGLVDIMADVIVDCTGDADIAYFSGAPTLKETGNLAPQTLLLNVSNIDNYSSKYMVGVAKQAKEKYPLVPDNWGLSRISNCNHFYINHAGTKGMGNFDITDPEQYSKAECLSRRQVVQMTEAMREFGANTLKNCEIVNVSPQIGVRESRRIKGSYILTEEDSLNGSKFDDVIAWRSGWLDIGFVRVTQMKIHQVPYRCIVPEQINGLLAAGRCISASHEGAAAGKSIGNCIATGHAAGIAAAIASAERKSPVDLEVKKIQAALRNDGVDLTRGGEVQNSKMAN